MKEKEKQLKEVLGDSVIDKLSDDDKTYYDNTESDL